MSKVQLRNLNYLVSVHRVVELDDYIDPPADFTLLTMRLEPLFL